MVKPLTAHLLLLRHALPAAVSERANLGDKRLCKFLNSQISAQGFLAGGVNHGTWELGEDGRLGAGAEVAWKTPSYYDLLKRGCPECREPLSIVRDAQGQDWFDQPGAFVGGGYVG